MTLKAFFIAVFTVFMIGLLVFLGYIWGVNMAKFAPAVDRAGLELEAESIRSDDAIKIAKQHDNKATISRVNSVTARDRTEHAEKELDSVIVPDPPTPQSPLGIERAAMLDLIRKQQFEIQTLKLEVLDLKQARDSWRFVAESEKKMVFNLRNQFKVIHKKNRLLSFKVGSVTFAAGAAIGFIGGILAVK